MCAISKQQNPIKATCSVENLRLISLVSIILWDPEPSLQRGKRRRRRKERRGEECADQNSNCRFLIKLSSSQEFTFLAPKHSLVAVNLLKMESEWGGKGASGQSYQTISIYTFIMCINKTRKLFACFHTLPGSQPGWVELFPVVLQGHWSADRVKGQGHTAEPGCELGWACLLTPGASAVRGFHSELQGTLSGVCSSAVWGGADVRRSGQWEGGPLPTSGSRPERTQGTAFCRSHGAGQGPAWFVHPPGLEHWGLACWAPHPPRGFTTPLGRQDAGLGHGSTLNELSAQERKIPRDGPTEDM